jgi:small nuclear ribonucleoprotein (snRNP)-like protein
MDHTDHNDGAVQEIKALLTRFLRITTTDGRVFIGTFAGTDKPLNIILINAEEYRFSEPGVGSIGRFVGQVIFPWKIVVKVEAQVGPAGRRQQADNELYIW